jgi:tetratricopeptide (TPR) repeat protein
MSAPSRAINTRPLLTLMVSVVAVMGWVSLPAAESDDQTVTAASTVEPPNAKAGKYHDVLLRRPRPDYLFDRFVDAWLIDGSLDQLESFLRGRADAGAETADQLLLAFFYSKGGRDVEAQQTFARAAEMAPDHPAVFYHQAKVAARLLDVETAIASLERAGALAHEQETSDALLTDIASLHGRLLIQSGSVEEALAVWQELLQIRPQDEGLREDLVELLVDQGQFDQALEAGERLIALTDDPYQQVMHTLRQGAILLPAGKRD